MLLAKILLVAHGLMSLVYGVAVLLDPAGLAQYMGLEVQTGDGVAELITMYVGMAGAIGAFMLYAVFDNHWTPTALVFLVVVMTGVALGRLGSFVILDTGTYTLNALAYDIPALILGWIALFRRNSDGGAIPSPVG